MDSGSNVAPSALNDGQAEKLDRGPVPPSGRIIEKALSTPTGKGSRNCVYRDIPIDMEPCARCECFSCFRQVGDPINGWFHSPTGDAWEFFEDGRVKRIVTGMEYEATIAPTLKPLADGDKPEAATPPESWVVEGGKVKAGEALEAALNDAFNAVKPDGIPLEQPEPWVVDSKDRRALLGELIDENPELLKGAVLVVDTVKDKTIRVELGKMVSMTMLGALEYAKNEVIRSYNKRRMLGEMEAAIAEAHNNAKG